MAVSSLLAVAGAHAYLTQGQVRLARLQQQLANEVVTHRTLELEVAQLENPQRIVAQAQKQGLVAPAQIGDLPEVPLSKPIGSAEPASSSAGSTGAVTPAPAGPTSPTGASSATAMGTSNGSSGASR